MPGIWSYRSARGEGRLGRLCDAAIDGIEASPDAQPGDRVIILINDDSTKAGIALSGYDGDRAAVADIVVYLRALAGPDLPVVLAALIGRSPN
jgi:hypothetical protein